MSKFNLKTYQKVDGDLHIDKKLQDQHAKAPNHVTDKQLDKDKRIENNPDSVTEKQLDSVRAEDEGRTIEGRLNKSKPRFDIKHRNEETYKGDINKLEEKRVASDKNEDEKYELASGTKKELRWWETKSDDGLKLAGVKEVMKKLAQSDEEDDREIEEDYLASRNPRSDARSFQQLDRMWGQMEGEDERDPGNEFGADEDFSVNDDDIELGVNKDVYLAEKRDPIGVAGMPYGAFYSIGYDPEAWEDEEELQQAVVEKILELRPDLEGKISTDMLSRGKTIGTVGYYNLRLVGNEFSPDAAEETFEGETMEDFTELDFGPTDVGGTSMLAGKVKISPEVSMDEEDLREAIADFINSKHPEADLTADSIQIDATGETATFAVSANGMDFEEAAPPPSKGATPPAAQAPVEQASTPSFAPEEASGETPSAVPPDTSAVEPEEQFELIDDTAGDEEQFELIDDTLPNPPKSASSISKIVLADDTKKK